MNTMEKRRSAFNNFAIICNVLNAFAMQENDETVQKLRNTVKTINGGMPLPSGRYGNPLAVALEMQLYQGALFMIKNASDLGIDLNAISSEYGGKNVWNVQQTFADSQLDFDMTKIDDSDVFYRDYPWLIQSKNGNIDAAAEIESILKEKYKENSK